MIYQLIGGDEEVVYSLGFYDRREDAEFDAHRLTELYPNRDEWITFEVREHSIELRPQTDASLEMACVAFTDLNIVRETWGPR